MEITFKYIRNRIREYRKEDLLSACYRLLDLRKDELSPIWFVFLLMKWTYLYGGEKYPSKQLTDIKFRKLLNMITNFNEEHISSFIKEGKVDRAFHILDSQQFYLQTVVYKEKFATQLKLYDSLKSRYDINKSFELKTGLSISDFIQIMQITWLYSNVDILESKEIKFYGYLENDFLLVASKMIGLEKIQNFLKLLVLDPLQPQKNIEGFSRNVRKEELQSMERTFFTLYPLQIYDKKIKLIHKNVFNYSINYYVYDFLKANDDKFTTEFGQRFEKYIGFGLEEIGNEIMDEVELKKILPKKSNVIDFWSKSDNVFIECKAIEIQPYPAVNPTDDLLYSSLKDSVLKAYFKQLLHVANYLSPKKENYGIILTYKRFFWSHFIDLYELGKDKFKLENGTDSLPPENVFIIDVYTWDNLVQIIKEGKTSLLDILKLAKQNNSKSETKKQSFDMHLDDYEINQLNLSYLEEELKELEIRESTTHNRVGSR
nr:hypothetical protein [uncultured Marinifilum sp.]